MTLLSDPQMEEREKLRLVILFSLRYETDSGFRNYLAQLFDRLGTIGVSKNRLVGTLNPKP